MVDLITNVGEEWFYETNTDGATVECALYEDATNSLGESAQDPGAAITTEPTGASYARQSSTVSTRNNAGAFGIDNDSQLTFDTSNSTQSVDAAAIIVNFQSDTVAGQAGANDNIVAAGDLSQTRDLSSVDQLEIAAGELDIEDM